MHTTVSVCGCHVSLLESCLVISWYVYVSGLEEGRLFSAFPLWLKGLVPPDPLLRVTLASDCGPLRH
jgi:hypothetical protein